MDDYLLYKKFIRLDLHYISTNNKLFHSQANLILTQIAADAAGV